MFFRTPILLAGIFVSITYNCSEEACATTTHGTIREQLSAGQNISKGEDDVQILYACATSERPTFGNENLRLTLAFGIRMSLFFFAKSQMFFYFFFAGDIYDLCSLVASRRRIGFRILIPFRESFALVSCSSVQKNRGRRMITQSVEEKRTWKREEKVFGTELEI